VAYNFPTGKNDLKLLTEYEILSQKVLFGNAVLTAFMSWKIYDVISQNIGCSREGMCIIWFFKIKPVTKTQNIYRTQHGKDPPSDNAINFEDGYSMMKHVLQIRKCKSS
jgi:hypothetical protein